MATVTEAINTFLASQPHNAPDLVARWTPQMETQLNVSARGGEPVEGKPNTYTDGQFTWWNIRVPRKANSEPTWHDYELEWPLALYAEAIGATGWDWRDRVSRWVGFDFDSITGHATGVGIGDEQLEKIKQLACNLPYVEVRKSTGGAGVHLYVLVDAIPTANHTEHAALARCILSMMSSECGFDFASQVDTCGGNLWIWHRKMTAENEGLKLLKGATETLTTGKLPINWKDHVEVVTKRRSKIRVTGISEGETDIFESLASGQQHVPLDNTHKDILEAIGRLGYSCVWIPDHHLAQTHTKALAELVESQNRQLGLKGFFSTNSEGTDKATPNCFMFPLRDGGFRVYRFNKGVVESNTWRQDGQGWTWCELNRTPDLGTASLAVGGTELPDDGGYSFPNAKMAAQVVEALGQKLSVPVAIEHEPAVLKRNKDGRLVVEIVREKGHPPDLAGWDASKRGVWRQVVNVRVDTGEEEIEFDKFDKLIRSLVTPAGDRAGWIARSLNGEWVKQPKDDLRSILSAFGKNRAEGDQVLGLCAVRHWSLVNLPFQPEYPGGRKWNREAPQYRFQPAALDYDEAPHHPHWDRILNHIGNDLTHTVKKLEWCQRANVLSGADYLKQWIACLLREPFEPLPYLFLYGPQNSGKSILHEAIALLITKGVAKADRAITNAAEFNYELANAVLCYIEEKNISQFPAAYNRIKDWVTAREISIRKMRTDSYSQPNTTHWIQCANKQEHCPVFPGDTRITVIYVPELLDEIPKKVLVPKLEEEAPHFMRTILNLELAKVEGRLRLPVIRTDRKLRSESLQRTSLEEFIEEHCYKAPGKSLLFSEFYDAFIEWVDPHERHQWSKRRVSSQLPEDHPTGRGNYNKVYLGNLSLQPVEIEPDAKMLRSLNNRLVAVEDEPLESTNE